MMTTRGRVFQIINRAMVDVIDRTSGVSIHKNMKTLAPEKWV